MDTYVERRRTIRATRITTAHAAAFTKAATIPYGYRPINNIIDQGVFYGSTTSYQVAAFTTGDLSVRTAPAVVNTNRIISTIFYTTADPMPT